MAGDTSRLVRFANFAPVARSLRSPRGLLGCLISHASRLTSHKGTARRATTPDTLIPHPSPLPQGNHKGCPYDLTPPSSPSPSPSLLTPHSSLLPPHSSPLTPHPSPLTPHSSLLTPHSYDLPPRSPQRSHYLHGLFYPLYCVDGQALYGFFGGVGFGYHGHAEA